MRETQKAQSESHKQNLTVCLPMTDSSAPKALALFKHLDGQTPHLAEAEVVTTSWSNDASYSCEIKFQCSDFAGIKFFGAAPDEGFDYGQVFAGRYRDEEIDVFGGEHDGKFKTVEELSEWLFTQMQPTHPFFKDWGITPLLIQTKEMAEVYLTKLHKHGLSYHMDECPWDCLRNQDLTIWERLLIEFYHDQMWKWCDKNNEDIHGMCLRLLFDSKDHKGRPLKGL
jgi:hypothetical protein